MVKSKVLSFIFSGEQELLRVRLDSEELECKYMGPFVSSRWWYGGRTVTQAGGGVKIMGKFSCFVENRNHN